MNYLDASIRGINPDGSEQKKIPNPVKRKNDASIEELKPKDYKKSKK